MNLNSLKSLLKIYAIRISNLPLGAFGFVNPRDNSLVQLP